jgi:hypothetical protein
MPPPIRWALAVALAVALALPATASARSDPADQPPFGGDPIPVALPLGPDRAPPDFRLDLRSAREIAEGTAEVRAEQAERQGGPSLLPGVVARADRTWEVTYRDADGTPQVLVVIDDRTGEVLEAWTGTQVETKLARGYPGAVAGIVNAVWIWIPLCLLFLAPFIDLRRPLRLLHLDLAALLAFSVSLYFFNRGEIGVSAPLVYPVLAYLFPRLALMGFRPQETEERLLPHMGPRLIVGGILALVALHVVIAVFEAKVIDVGLASVIGADRVTDGEFLYGAGSATGQPIRVDVYGPINYLAYVPFEQVFPWSGEWDSVPAARAASLSFDLLTALCLFALGGRLRAGAEGRTLGLALSFAWLAYPFTLYGIGSSFNDMLVALLVTASLLVLSSAPARGAVTALAALTKFGPLALVPLLAAGTGERRPRSLIAFALAFLAVAGVATALVIDGSGLREMYDRSLGYQAGRGSPFSIWGQAPSLEPLQTLITVAAVGFGTALFFVPQRRTAIQVAALGGAALIAIQVPATHWLYPYALWFAPLALVAFLAPHRSD